jgi:hypothetical protein
VKPGCLYTIIHLIASAHTYRPHELAFLHLTGVPLDSHSRSMILEAGQGILRSTTARGVMPNPYASPAPGSNGDGHTAPAAGGRRNRIRSKACPYPNDAAILRPTAVLSDGRPELDVPVHLVVKSGRRIKVETSERLMFGILGWQVLPSIHP